MNHRIYTVGSLIIITLLILICGWYWWRASAPSPKPLRSYTPEEEQIIQSVRDVKIQRLSEKEEEHVIDEVRNYKPATTTPYVKK